MSGNKAPKGLCGTRSQPGCGHGPWRCFTAEQSHAELNPRLLRAGKAGRAPMYNQVSFIALKIYVAKSKALVWGSWKCSHVKPG